jgi:Transposase IS116/IS110/IS902 family
LCALSSRYQSGEVDRSGRISEQDDALLRGYLYEAATVLISRLQRSYALRTWARAPAERIGVKKARVTLARKLAVLLHHLWSHQEDFRWARHEHLSAHCVVPAGDAGSRDRGKGGGKARLTHRSGPPSTVMLVPRARKEP